MMFVDVHTHIFHRQFAGEEELVTQRAQDAGLGCVIVNGLEPKTNRTVLDMCAKHEHLYPAVGIYPVDAGCNAISSDAWDAPFDPPEAFDVDEEIDWIESKIPEIIAIGECGLDRYWIDDEPTRREQERVLERFCELSVKHDIPLILHTRKAEQRTLEILKSMNVVRADFHCYGGKLKLAKRIADEGYYFSIPPVVERSGSFQALARSLPQELILTETDAPYMSPDKGERNEPANVPRGVAAIALARDEDAEDVKSYIDANCRRLFFHREIQ